VYEAGSREPPGKACTNRLSLALLGEDDMLAGSLWELSV
jgi:hypothetical protein